MAKVDDVIENPVSGQRLIFGKMAQDTGGEIPEVDSLKTKPTPSRLVAMVARRSRRLGRVGQLENALPCRLRDRALAMLEEVVGYEV
jgi:hypothetical protein